MPPSATSRILRRIETLACTVCLATAVHAQRQPSLSHPQEHPAGDPLDDEMLIRPIHLDKHDALEQHEFFVFDFKTAFPPYTREADTICEAILPHEMVSDIVDAEDTINEVQDDAHVETDATPDEAIIQVPKEEEADDSAGDRKDEQNGDAIDSQTNREAVPETVSSSEPIADNLDQIDLQKSLVLSEEHVQQEFSDEKNECSIDDKDGQPTENSLPNFTSTEKPDENLTNAVDSIQSENEVKIVHDVPEELMPSSSDDAKAVFSPQTLEVSLDVVHNQTSEQLADIAGITPPQEDGGDDTSTAEEEKRSSEQQLNQKEISSEFDGNFREDVSQGHPSSRTEDELILTSDKITVGYDEPPPLSNIQYKDEDANREFVTGLDEIDKLFESVSPPDELDVGADGSSIQDVLVGQGLKIIFKRAKNFGSNMKERVEKIVEKALPQQLMILTSGHRDDGDEEDSLEDILKMLKGDVPMRGSSNIDVTTTKQTDGIDDNAEFSNDRSQNALRNRFPLLKTKQANKIWKYARKKWEQVKHLFDEFFAIFEGNVEDDDDEDIGFYSELGRINYDEMRSLIEKNSLKRKEGSELPQFGIKLDDSFVRSRYDAMMKLHEKNRKGLDGAYNKK